MFHLQDWWKEEPNTAAAEDVGDTQPVQALDFGSRFFVLLRVLAKGQTWIFST